MKETEKAYIAGLLDGEGSIYLYQKKMKEGRYVTGVVVVVTGTNKAFIEEVAQMVESRCVGRGIRYSPNQKPFYAVSFYTSKAVKFLKNVSPYLWLKKRQAEVFLELHERMEMYGKGRPLSKQEVSARLRLMEECKELNKRGL